MDKIDTKWKIKGNPFIKKQKRGQNTFDELLTKFVKGAAAEREKLAEKLIEEGYNPEYVTIGERVWYDDKTYTMRYECFPINKNVNVT